MKPDKEKTFRPDNLVVTISVVLLATILRIIVGDDVKAIKIVSVINLVMLLYVLVRIGYSTHSEVSSQRGTDQMGKSQVEACKRFNFIGLIVFGVCSITYVIMQFIFANYDSFFAILNDIIAIFTFGMSIEEERIESMLFCYFKNRVFM